jgi:hypothetical protein
MSVTAGLLFSSLHVARAGDESNASKLQQLIDTAYKAGSKQVTIPAGTYRFEGQPAWTRAYLNFWELHDFVIDATGVTLVGTAANSCLLRFESCNNVTLR